MRVAGHLFEIMSPAEVEIIHRNALRILAEIGLEIQNQSLLNALKQAGCSVDLSAQRARFPAVLVERFIADAEKFDWQQMTPSVAGSAGVYHGMYHDPHSNQLVDWNETHLSDYFALAAHLSNIQGASMLGCRLPCPSALEPLYERLYCWKYGAHEGSSIYLDEICPYLLELYQLRADMLGKPLNEVFRGTVYLVPALRLGVHEAYQVAWFWKKGIRVGIGDMYALGANAPVTLAGAVTLNLAEQLALRILDWALWGTRNLHLGGSLSVMDMRSMIYPYGRPEMAVTNMMMAQMARHYGAAFHGHAGLSDAKLPSVEAGYQKALTAIPTLLATGSFSMDAGLLSIDEVCSAVQLVLDDEFLSALKRFAHQFEVSDESIGFETILEAGPAGQYLDKEHTVRYLRKEHWQPGLWSREMLRPWLEAGGGIDADRARQKALDIIAKPKQTFLSEDQAKAIQAVIRHAEGHLNGAIRP